MDIYGYARLSRATEESTSIAKQRQIIEQTVERRGDTLLGFYTDEDVSALKRPIKDRPGLVKALAEVKAHGSAGLMVWRLDRIARNVGEFMQIVDAGVEVISATEPIDTTTPMGRAMAQVLQVFAELESRTTGLRISHTLAYLRDRGRWTGGNPPYGYRPVPHPDGQGTALDLEPDEVAIIRYAVGRILDDRKTLHSVVLEMNAKGLKPRKGTRWTVQVLKRILLSPATLGRMVVKGDVVRDERGVPITFWPPILAPEEQMALRPLITGDPKSPRRGRNSRLLSGLIRCDGCGFPMTIRIADPKKGRAYGCSASSKGVICPAPAYVSCELSEAEVERRFLDRLGDWPVLTHVEAVPDDPGLILIEEAIQDTAKAMTQPGADVVALSARMADLHAEREAIKARPQPQNEPILVESDMTYAQKWAESGIETRRAMLEDAGTEVRVRKIGRGAWKPERLKVILWNAGGLEV